MNIIINYGYSVPTARRALAQRQNDLSSYGDLHHITKAVFADRVREVVEELGLFVLFQGNGHGIYEGEEEPAGCLVATGTLSPLDLETLQDDLASLAQTFYQDSIALTVATDVTFCGPGPA